MNRNLVKFGFACDAISNKQALQKQKHKWVCLLTQFPKDRQYTTCILLVTEMECVSWLQAESHA